MFALTLRQPWASLMDVKAKTLETRSWSTDYRGELVITASQGYDFAEYEYELRPEFARHLRGAYPGDISLPRGVALCVVRLLACVKTKDLHKLQACGFKAPAAEELLFGNFEEGRYVWATEYVRRLDHRPRVFGAQGLWTFPQSQLEVHQ